MGKPKRNNNWKDKRQQAKKKQNTNPDEHYSNDRLVLENKSFEAYYKFCLKEEFTNESDFNRFLATLKEKLPVTFRINENVPNYKNFLEKIKHPDFVKNVISAAAAAGQENKEMQTEEKKEGENEEVDYDSIQEQIKLSNVSWYPRDLVWELTTFRYELKRNKAYQGLHKFLQQANDSGLITRQELVSMLPPLLLDVQSDDIVFDMCAAPGSKTSQLLEFLYRDGTSTGKLTQGGVLANDVDNSRAHMLIHQLQRISTAGMMVVNHHAQSFPTLKAEGEAALGSTNRFYFDKILADVPCTGDGAIRKIPQKWATWSPRDGVCLHGLQLQILMRAVQLCKIGGLVLYSTCSINPIEDEAVVTELFRKCNADALELVDITPRVPGLIARKGLLQWPVCEARGKDNIEEEKKEGEKKDGPENFFNIYESFDQIPKDYKGQLRATMFPDSLEKMRDVYKIQNTIRLMPHDQNTGGFYLALIRKKNHVVFGGQGGNETKTEVKQAETKITVEEDEEAEQIKKVAGDVDENEALKHALEATGEKETKKAQPSAIVEEPAVSEETEKKKGSKKKETFVTLEKSDWESIRDYYGLDEQLRELFIQQTHGEKKVLLISPGIRKVLDLDKSKGLVIKLNAGVKAFSKNKDAFKEFNCVYRLCQDAISSIFPLMSKRKIKCSAEEFKFFIENNNVKYQDIPNEELRNQIQAAGQGSLVLYCENEGVVQDRDYIVCLTHAASITPMASKELVNSYKIRYLDSQ